MLRHYVYVSTCFSVFNLNASLTNISILFPYTTLFRSIVPATARGVAHTGPAERSVRTVAVCPGAGDSFVEAAARTGADAYITSDLRHHPALEHVEAAADATGVPALLDVSHAASESLWLPLAKDLLARTVPGLEVLVSTRSSDPWTGTAV